MAKEFFGRQHARCEYQDDKVGSIGILGCNRRRGSNTGSDRRPLFVAPPPRTKNKESGRGMTVGRRLYVYMSGHGFSPRPSRGCLFTANATMDFGANVYPSAWLDWFRDSGYFSEFVLWLDCCMNRVGTIPPSEVQLAPKTSPEAAGRHLSLSPLNGPLRLSSSPSLKTRVRATVSSRGRSLRVCGEPPLMSSE